MESDTCHIQHITANVNTVALAFLHESSCACVHTHTLCTFILRINCNIVIGEGIRGVVFPELCYYIALQRTTAACEC